MTGYLFNCQVKKIEGPLLAQNTPTNRLGTDKSSGSDFFNEYKTIQENFNIARRYNLDERFTTSKRLGKNENFHYTVNRNGEKLLVPYAQANAVEKEERVRVCNELLSEADSIQTHYNNNKESLLKIYSFIKERFPQIDKYINPRIWGYDQNTSQVDIQTSQRYLKEVIIEGGNGHRLNNEELNRSFLARSLALYQKNPNAPFDVVFKDYFTNLNSLDLNETNKKYLLFYLAAIYRTIKLSTAKSMKENLGLYLTGKINDDTILIATLVCSRARDKRLEEVGKSLDEAAWNALVQYTNEIDEGDQSFRNGKYADALQHYRFKPQADMARFSKYFDDLNISQYGGKALENRVQLASDKAQGINQKLDRLKQKASDNKLLDIFEKGKKDILSQFNSILDPESKTDISSPADVNGKVARVEDAIRALDRKLDDAIADKDKATQEISKQKRTQEVLDQIKNFDSDMQQLRRDVENQPESFERNQKIQELKRQLQNYEEQIKEPELKDKFLKGSAPIVEELNALKSAQEKMGDQNYQGAQSALQKYSYPNLKSYISTKESQKKDDAQRAEQQKVQKNIDDALVDANRNLRSATEANKDNDKKNAGAYIVKAKAAVDSAEEQNKKIEDAKQRTTNLEQIQAKRTEIAAQEKQLDIERFIIGKIDEVNNLVNTLSSSSDPKETYKRILDIYIVLGLFLSRESTEDGKYKVNDYMGNFFEKAAGQSDFDINFLKTIYWPNADTQNRIETLLAKWPDKLENYVKDPEQMELINLFTKTDLDENGVDRNKSYRKKYLELFFSIDRFLANLPLRLIGALEKGTYVRDDLNVRRMVVMHLGSSLRNFMFTQGKSIDLSIIEQASLNSRIRAWAKKNGRSLPTNLALENAPEKMVGYLGLLNPVKQEFVESFKEYAQPSPQLHILVPGNKAIFDDSQSMLKQQLVNTYRYYHKLKEAGMGDAEALSIQMEIVALVWRETIGGNILMEKEFNQPKKDKKTDRSSNNT